MRVIWKGTTVTSHNATLPVALLAGILSLTACSLQAQLNFSRWVCPGPSGRLQYLTNALGDRIPDFSMVGYQGGGVPLPDLTALLGTQRAVMVSPVDGDDGAAIQAAIDRVSAMPLQEDGFRGLVQLAAGEYQIEGQLRIRASGVVLRGAGDEPQGTVLRATGKSQRAVIVVDPGSGSWRPVAGTERIIADKYVPVGATSFRLRSTDGLSPGDRVIVRRPSTADWIRDLGMDRIPPGSGTVQWAPGSKDLLYDRVITRIERDRVFLNAPLANSFDSRYGGGTLYKYEFPQRIRNVGIERMTGISDFSGPTDEDHAWDFIDIERAENAWVRNITARHFAYAAVNLGEFAASVTVEDSKCLDPVSQITGGRRYSFNVDGQMNLVRDVQSRDGRHDFVQGSLTHGPNVFFNSRADRAHDESGPHHRWSTGTLFDNIIIPEGTLAAWNRGNMGTGHGWSGANMVFWNCQAKAFRVQNPFTAQNWVMGGAGAILTPQDFLRAPIGIYDSHGQRVSLGDPANNPLDSLYLAQLSQRLAHPGAQTREYLLGDCDSYTDDGAGSDDQVEVDRDWLTEVMQYAADRNLTVERFDRLAPDQLVPFTFVFQLASEEQVIAASLTVALKKAGEWTGSEAVWLEAMNGSSSALLREHPISDAGILVLDLTPARLSLLGDGKLNLAVGEGLAIDWAKLEIVAAPDPAPHMAVKTP